MWPRWTIFKILAALVLTTFQPSTCWDDNPENAMLFEVIEGQVECENFTYYIVDGRDNTILVNLTSLSGDCDLYIRQALQPGQYPPNPSVETHSYDLASTTCGQDVVLIPSALVRPFSIGIYAHPSHHQCTYRLEISATPVESNEIANELEWSDHDQPNSVPNQQARSSASKQQQQQQNQHQKQKTHKGSSDFDSFIELLINFAIQFIGFLFEIIV